jgi:hypothetical protein
MSAMKNGFTIVIVAAVALVGFGCGDDDGDEGAQVASASVERYCELTRELDRAGGEIFEDLEKDPDATPKDFEAAERQMVEENEGSLEELQEVVPAEIQNDVAILVEALRARAGLEAEVSPDAEAAETRIDKFEKQNCA